MNEGGVTADVHSWQFHFTTGLAAVTRVISCFILPVQCSEFVSVIQDDRSIQLLGGCNTETGPKTYTERSVHEERLIIKATVSDFTLC